MRVSRPPHVRWGLRIIAMSYRLAPDTRARGDALARRDPFGMSILGSGNGPRHLAPDMARARHSEGVPIPRHAASEKVAADADTRRESSRRGATGGLTGLRT